MPKLKQLPAIMANFLKDVAKGDLSASKASFRKYLIHKVDKHLKNNGINDSIRYSVWKHNNSRKMYRIATSSQLRSSKITFGIIYFYDKTLKKTAYHKILECLQNQIYNNYHLFPVNDNIHDLVPELTKKCTHICFIEQNDLIASHALGSIAERIEFDDNLEVIYSDEDIINKFGVRASPYFKPQYSPLLLLSHNYMNALLCLKLTDDVMQEMKMVKKLNQGFIYQLVLKCMNRGVKSQRIADVLYHRHWKNTRKLKNTSTKGIAQDQIKRRQLKAEILDYKIKGFNVIKLHAQGNPKVSIIIPFRDKISLVKACIRSIETKSTYHNYEIILIDNRSKEEETLEYIKDTKYKVIMADIDFNYSKLNNIGAQAAEGEYLILLNNDTEVITSDWIESLLGLAQLPEVGAVGAKLLFPSNKIQHVGVVMATHHINRKRNANKGGYKQYNNLVREYSSVTGACLMISKKKYQEVGGLAESLAVQFNDIDFCFRVLRAGYYNIYNPHCILYHNESASRKNKFEDSADSEYIYMKKKWNEFRVNDPFYNPNFSREQAYFCIRIDR